jgi:hypothetical protein
MHDSMAGSGVGAAYRAHDSNSPNEVSFIASSEWVGLGKIVPLRAAAGFRRLRRYRGRNKTVGTRNLPRYEYYDSTFGLAVWYYRSV